jgi:hypothetical protein
MRRLLAGLAGAALLLGPLAPTATADDPAAEPGLRVEAVGPNADNGGFPTIYFGFYGLSATFTDTTPDDTHRYVATATEVGGEGVVVEEEAEVWEGWDGTYAMRVYLPNEERMQVGDTFEVVVSEYDGDTLVEQSEPVSHTVEVVSHPEKLRVKSASKKFFRAGEVVKLRWTGEYGPDARVTQVIAARKPKDVFQDERRDFLVCQNSYCPTKKGVDWVGSKSRELVTRFRIPAHMAGKVLTISIYGTAKVVDGVAVAAPWGWFREVKVRR